MTTWIFYHIFCLLSTANFIFLKFFLIVCFLKTIICDSSVIIPLGVMLVNHKIQIFLDFMEVYLKGTISFLLLSYYLPVYYLLYICFFISFFAECATPVAFLDSSVLIGIFYTNLTFQDRTPSPLPSPVLFFSCRLEASARGRWHRAGLLWRRGDYYLGCGRRRYCGRVCCLSRRRVLALPQCF